MTSSDDDNSTMSKKEKTSSVFDSTKDLLEPAEEAPTGGGVDWKWGNDDLPSPRKDAADPADDSDGTAQMTEEEDNDDDEEDGDETVEMDVTDELELQENAESKPNTITQEPKPSQDQKANETSSSKDAKDDDNDATMEINDTKEDIKKKSKEEIHEESSDDETKNVTDEELLEATEYLFLAADKDSVTVGEIFRALEAQFDSKLEKPARKTVRTHLVNLMIGNISPSVKGPQAEEQEDEISAQGDSEDSGSEQEDEEDGDDKEASPPKKSEKKSELKKEEGDDASEASEFEQDDEADDENEEYAPKKGVKKRKPRKKVADGKKEKALRPKRPNQRKVAKAARMVENLRLRKKRMEELKVRNEELQKNLSKEQQERAEAIAARFETNTDEMRLKRIEDRINLLQNLDSKRRMVLGEAATLTELLEEARNEQEKEGQLKAPQQEQAAAKSPPPQQDESSENESSSDEEDLEIVGMVKRKKPLVPLGNALPSRSLAILEQVRSPQKRRRANKLPSVKMTSPTRSRVASPPRSTAVMGARDALRHHLNQKKRQVGNMWLARELGYNNEEEHLRDCQKIADQRRAQTLKLEQERQQLNERRLQRDRRLLEGEEVGGESEEETPKAVSTEESPEEDEEMQLANEIEKEQQANADEAPDEENAEDAEVPNEEEKATEAEAPESGKASHEPQKGESPSHASSPESQESLPPSMEESEGWETQPPITSTVAADITPAGPVQRLVSEDPSEPIDEDDDEGEEELELVDEADSAEKESKADKPRNAGWQAMLKREAEKLKKMKNRQGALVEDQAEEEEEEEIAGLEDFGFSVKKKKDDDDEDDFNADKLDEEDLEHVVDDLSDNEGDEEAGEAARKKLEQKEEKERHKEILRRMREGYDGRRGGVAGGTAGARGMHRFDQLVSADNREDAKRLGLLNDDEMDSEDEGQDETEKKGDGDDDDDEAALLDKMLKDRFLHRSNVDLEEEFSEDEAEEEKTEENESGNNSDEEEKTQERLAKRFAKRARMQRLEETYADSQEFSRQRLIDEDESMKLELKRMRNGLIRKRSTSSRGSFSSMDTGSSASQLMRQVSTGSSFGGSFLERTSGLSVALRTSRTSNRRTSFLGGARGAEAKDTMAQIHKSVALSHVVFQANTSQSGSRSAFSSGSALGKRKDRPTASLFQKVTAK